MINTGVFGNQDANFAFLNFYLIRRKKEGRANVSVKQKKRKLPSHKSLCCQSHGGVIKQDPSTITAAAGSLQRDLIMGPRETTTCLQTWDCQEDR